MTYRNEDLESKIERLDERVRRLEGETRKEQRAVLWSGLGRMLRRVLYWGFVPGLSLAVIAGSIMLWVQSCEQEHVAERAKCDRACRTLLGMRRFSGGERWWTHTSDPDSYSPCVCFGASSREDRRFGRHTWRAVRVVKFVDLSYSKIEEIPQEE